MGNYSIGLDNKDPLEEIKELQEKIRKRMKPLVGKAEEIHQSILPRLRDILGDCRFGGEAFSLDTLDSIGRVVTHQNKYGYAPLIYEPVSNLDLAYLTSNSSTFNAWSLENSKDPKSFLASALAHEYGHVWYDFFNRMQFRYTSLDLIKEEAQRERNSSYSEAFAFWLGDTLSKKTTPKSIMQSYLAPYNPSLIVEGYNKLKKNTLKKGAKSVVRSVFEILV